MLADRERRRQEWEEQAKEIHAREQAAIQASILAVGNASSQTGLQGAAFTVVHRLLTQLQRLPAGGLLPVAAAARVTTDPQNLATLRNAPVLTTQDTERLLGWVQPEGEGRAAGAGQGAAGPAGGRPPGPQGNEGGAQGMDLADGDAEMAAAAAVAMAAAAAAAGQAALAADIGGLRPAEPETEREFAVERTQGSRSRCRTCFELIEQSTLRVRAPSLGMGGTPPFCDCLHHELTQLDNYFPFCPIPRVFSWACANSPREPEARRPPS